MYYFLQDQYPEVDFGDKYLCSGGIIGYAPALWKTIHVYDVSDAYDDQLYYTKIYINPTLRVSWCPNLRAPSS